VKLSPSTHTTCRLIFLFIDYSLSSLIKSTRGVDLPFLNTHHSHCSLNRPPKLLAVRQFSLPILQLHPSTAFTISQNDQSSERAGIRASLQRWVRFSKLAVTPLLVDLHALMTGTCYLTAASRTCLYSRALKPFPEESRVQEGTPGCFHPGASDPIPRHMGR